MVLVKNLKQFRSSFFKEMSNIYFIKQEKIEKNGEIK